MFAQGANHPVVDYLLMSALKSLLLWIICVQRKKNPLSTGLEFVRRYAQDYWLFGSFLRMDVFCVRTQTFPTLDYLRTQASTLGHGCILRTCADIPKMILASNFGLFAHMSKYLDTWMYSAFVRSYS